MSKGLPSLKRLLTLSLCTVLCTALMCTFTPSTHAWPKGGGGGGGNGGGGNGSGEDPPPPSNLPEYTIEFVGDGTTLIRGMNDFGDLVGSTSTGLPFPYESVPYVEIAGLGTIDLNSLLDPDSDWILLNAFGINDSGQIVGNGYGDSDGDGTVDRYIAFRVTLDPGPGLPLFEELELSDPLDSSNFMAINDDGDVFGAVGDRLLWSEDQDGDGALDFVDLSASVGGGWAGGITDRFVDPIDGVEKIQITTNGEGIASLWRWTGDLDGNGTLESLDTLSGHNGLGGGYGINDSGDVVGEYDFDDAFRYTDANGMEDLGKLLQKPKPRDLNEAIAWDINNVGEVVGWSGIGGDVRSLFLYHDDAGMIDLGPQIVGDPYAISLDSISDEVSSYSLFTNDAGQIAGNAPQGAFILTPVAP